MEQKNNTGRIFKNDYKKDDNHPDYKGKVIVDGVEKDIALWVNESKDGKKYFSAKFSEPRTTGGNTTSTGKPASKPKKNIQEDDDNLPF